MSKKEDWNPPETAPKDGRPIIAWLTSNSGLPPTTGTILWEDDGWVWADSGDAMRATIRGWQEYPLPPGRKRNIAPEPGAVC